MHARVQTLMAEVVPNVSRSKGGQKQSATEMELDCMKRQQQPFHPLKFTPLHMDCPAILPALPVCR